MDEQFFSRMREGETRYRVTKVQPRMGRSTVTLECESCGAKTYTYIWSWAGHGFRKCSGCGLKMPYTRGEIR